MFGCIHERLNRKNIATWSSQRLRIIKTNSVYLLAVHRSEQNCLNIVFRVDKRSESVVQSMMTCSLVELVTEWAKLYHKVDTFPRDQAPLVSNICQNQYWRSLLQHTSYPVCATNSIQWWSCDTVQCFNDINIVTLKYTIRLNILALDVLPDNVRYSRNKTISADTTTTVDDVVTASILTP